jgi:hypothetical protein
VAEPGTPDDEPGTTKDRQKIGALSTHNVRSTTLSDLP